MKKKYIIELEDDQMAYGTTILDEVAYIKLLQTLPYTAPDLEQVKREAYREGREDGIHDGMCEAWEAARKILRYGKTGGKLEVLTDVFSHADGWWDIINRYTADEAIEKLKQYEQEQNKIIKVGDIVRLKGAPEIEIWVTDISDEDGGRLSGLALTSVGDNCEIGDTYAYREIHKFERTGKHYDVASVLEMMRRE